MSGLPVNWQLKNVRIKILFMVDFKDFAMGFTILAFIRVATFYILSQYLIKNNNIKQWQLFSN